MMEWCGSVQCQTQSSYDGEVKWINFMVGVEVKKVQQKIKVDGLEVNDRSIYDLVVVSVWAFMNNMMEQVRL